MKQNYSLENIRHSLAHLLAAAVLKKFPDAKLGVGPVIENGFYYDFLIDADQRGSGADSRRKLTLTEADLKDIEKAMKKMVGQKLPFTGKEIAASEGRKLFENQPFKLELIDDFTKEKAKLMVYQTGDIFTDLCRGGHVENTGEIDTDGFMLDRLAGAYWKGDEKNPQLQRVYGLAFDNKNALDEFLKMRVEVEKRDHRKLGKELDIFAFDEDVGPGLPLWLPNGATIIEELENLAKETERAGGYARVRTPHIAKESLYKTSGHLPYYADSMYPPMDYEGTKYYLKAMNCPHHHKIFAARPRSYRELPLRLAEYGTCYRQEKSGELFGLMRVRSLQMNDAHIYCSEGQFAEEFKRVNDMYLHYFKIFGIQKYVMRFSTHDPKKLGEKFVDEPELWKKTEYMVRDVLTELKIPFVEVPNEAAFYGPKIDVQVWSAIGREFTLATNQVDFAQPRRFGLSYTEKDGKAQTPLVIHRAPLGTHERVISFLIEHFAGAFPLWLAPVQVEIIPISEKFAEYGLKVLEKIRENNIRVKISDSNENLGKRIRAAEMMKIPYVLVVGEKEEKNGTVNVRKYGTEGRSVEMNIGTLIEKLKKEIEERTL